MSNPGDFIIAKNGYLTKYKGPRGEVVIPEGVSGIGSGAFAGGIGITGITFPASLKQADRVSIHGFRDCRNLVTISVSAQNKTFRAEGNCLVEIDTATVILGCNGSTIPKGITKIGDYAFSDCAKLERVSIPAGVTRIGTAAFSGCTGLNEIVIPDTVTSIGSGAFGGCRITSITLPECVTEVGLGVFSGCAALGYLAVLGELTDESWENIAQCCTPQFLFAPNAPEDVLKKHKLFRPAAMAYLRYSTQYTEPEIVKAYRKYIAAQRTRILPQILQNDCVEDLTTYANSGVITVANFEEGFLTPAQAANATQCAAFLLEWKAKNIPLEVVERHADRKLEKQLKPIDVNKVWRCEPLADGTMVITGYKGSEINVVIPEELKGKRVTAIGDKVFGCGPMSGKPAKERAVLRKIRSIAIPDSVTHIGNRAFENCENLEEILIPDSVTSIGDSAFGGCAGLTYIKLPTGVSDIGEWAFGGCTGLASVVLPDKVTSIGAGMFRGCKGLTGFVIPNGVMSIGDSAFDGCSGLASITIPDGVTSIGRCAFQGCTGLTNVVVPDGVESVGTWAFKDCKNLTDISIPRSVTSIGNWVFDGCAKFDVRVGICMNVTIHAPAGSYAERYAKENNIPFVAE